MSLIYGPRQVVLVTSKGRATVMGRDVTKDDIITVAWHMPTSFNPVLYAISIGKTRFSHTLINNSKAFIVNFIPSSLEQKAVLCGTHSGQHIDKFKLAGFTRQEAHYLDCPRIKEAIGFVECEVINKIDTGDHTIFVGKVLTSEMVRQSPRLYHMEGSDFTTTIS